ncbi:MAG: hypothetical protein J6U42_07315 [Lachnospiraceae bacterium]|nr:hypothetical protein [Lachnospiraceae bacterium]
MGKKRSLAIVMCLVMVLCILPARPSAAADTRDFVIKSQQLDPTGKYYLKLSVGNDEITQNFYDCGGGTKQRINDALRRKIITEVKAGEATPLYYWTDIANGLFRTEGNCASVDYDRFGQCFNTGNPSYDCFGEIREYLRDTSSKTKGSVGGNNMRSTGLQIAGDFTSVRDEMAKAIKAGIGRKALNVDDILLQGPVQDKTNKGSALSELVKIDNDGKDRTILYTIVTSVNQKTSLQYRYNSFGIAFYDFEPYPIVAKDLKYSFAGEGCSTPEEAKQKGVKGVVFDSVTEPKAQWTDNDTDKELNNVMNWSHQDSYTLTNSTTVTDSRTVGGSITLGFKFGTPKDGLIGKLLEVDISGQFNYSDTFSTSKQTAEAQTAYDNVGGSISMPLPAYTSGCTTQAKTTATLTEDYDMPMAVRYKVAVFSMTGGVYADDVSTSDFKSYDHGCYVNIFGTDSADKGLSAGENLYQRALVNPNNGRQDSSYGTVQKWTDSKTQAWTTEGVDWKCDFLANDAPTKKAIQDLAVYYPMLSGGCSYSVNYDTVKCSAGDVLPLYAPTRFEAVNAVSGDVQMAINGQLNATKQFGIKALNKKGGEYYGFDQSCGSWVVCDETGEPGTSDCISIEERSGDQIVKANKAGKGFITWKLKDGATLSGYKDGASSETVSASNDLPAPIISISVGQDFSGTISVTGEFTGCMGDEGKNLDDYFTVETYDATGKQVEVPYYWEAQELESKGLKVTEHGDLTMSAEGTFHVRACVNNGGDGKSNVYSDWKEITVNPIREIDKLEFDLSGTDVEVSNELSADEIDRWEYDLPSFVRAYDQYGDLWVNELPYLVYTVEGEAAKDATISNFGVLSIRGDGDFDVQAAFYPGIGGPQDSTRKIVKGKGTFSRKKTSTDTPKKSLKVKTSKITVKASKLKKKALTKKVIVTGAEGSITYKKLSGSKKLTINKKTGKIKIKKGTKKGTYKIKIEVSSGGVSVTKTIKVIVK